MGRLANQLISDQDVDPVTFCLFADKFLPSSVFDSVETFVVLCLLHFSEQAGLPKGQIHVYLIHASTPSYFKYKNSRNSSKQVENNTKFQREQTHG